VKAALIAWESLAAPAWTETAATISGTARALAARGAEVHIFTARLPGEAPEVGFDNVIYHRCTYDEDPDPQAELESLGREIAYRVAQEETREPFRVAHGFDWPAAAALSELRQQRPRHAVWSLAQTTSAWARPAWLLDSPEAQPLHRYHPDEFADLILVPSEPALEQFVSQWGTSRERTLVVHPAIDADWLGERVDPAVVKARFGFNTFDPVVLCLSPLTPRGRPDLLVDAMFSVLDSHANAKLIWVGDGSLREYALDRARVLGVSDSLRLLDYVPTAELSRLCQCCDVVCLPQRSTSLRAPFLEAWSAGKPVVITPSHAASAFVWHEVTGYVAEESDQDIAEGLLWLFEDFDRCRWVGENGRRAVADAFSYQAVATRLLDLYGALAAGSGANAALSLREAKAR
jgi:glycosyltransferase involved in cell wall biosynthesis